MCHKFIGVKPYFFPSLVFFVHQGEIPGTMEKETTPLRVGPGRQDPQARQPELSTPAEVGGSLRRAAGFPSRLGRKKGLLREAGPELGFQATGSTPTSPHPQKGRRVSSEAGSGMSTCG